MNDLINIDKTYLQPGYTDTKQDGFFAEFYDNGRLKEFTYYKNGSADNYWVLHIEKDSNSGRAVLKNGSGDSSDWEVYSNGHSEYFDAWSDNSKPQEVPFETWVKKWITKIYSIKSHE